MADPKYSKLPGIAFDQPDTYETEDLPESDQYIDFQEEESTPYIERPHISVEAAFERFRLKTVGGYAIDFDENIGYRSGLDGGAESTSAKLIRIKKELGDLTVELKTKSTLPTAKDEDQHHRTLLSELETQFGNLVRSNFGIDSSGLKEKLEGMNMNLKEGQEGKGKDKDKTLPSGAGSDQHQQLQYELMIEKKLSRSTAGAKATELEARIHRLENVLGANDGKDIMIPLELRPKNKTVLGALTVLHTKLSLLEPSHIELIEAKLSSVLDKVSKIAEKKLDVQELERTFKLTSLYELLESSSATIEALPEISTRLEALRELHTKAADIVRELGELKSVQDSLAAGTLENDMLLKELKAVLETVMIVK
jgi:dynactin-2